MRARSRRPHGLLVLCVLLIIGDSPHTLATKVATPPTAKELVGIWIGFDKDQLTFNRLDLRNDSTGFWARVSPADTILHEQGVHLYRIAKWKVAGWNLEIQMSPISNAFPIGYVRGHMGIASLILTIGGPENGGWKEEPFLTPENRVLTSNKETRDKIEGFERH